MLMVYKFGVVGFLKLCDDFVLANQKSGDFCLW